MADTYRHQDTAEAMADAVASYKRKPRTELPATPAAVLEALGGSYVEGTLTRYSGGGGCSQELLGANGLVVILRDGPGRPATAELVGPDPLMEALLASVERERNR